MKLKEIKKIYAAEDITNYGFEKIQKLKEKEKGFYEVAVSTGVYGVNGVLLQGNKTNRLYKIVSRNSTLDRLV